MKHGFSRALVGGWIVACVTSVAAWAQTDFCAPFVSSNAEAEVRAKLGGKDDEALVQSGVREFLRDPDPLLDDGSVGEVTVGKLAKICAEVPLAAGTPALEGTMNLAREYGRLGRLAKGWRAGLGDLSRRLGVPEPGLAPLALRLAATPQVTAVALRGVPGNPAICDDLSGKWPGLPQDQLPMITTALAAIAALDPSLAKSQPDVALANRICLSFPVAGAATDFGAALERLGVIQAGNPAAIQLLSEDGFAAWLQLDPNARIPRLLGTAPAVLRLLSDFQTGRPVPAAPPEIKVTLPDCAVAKAPSGFGYWRISQPSIDALQPAANTRDLLAGSEKVTAPSPADLSVAVAKALGVAPGSCTAEMISAVTTAYSGPSQRYSLDPEGLINLKTNAILAPFVPNLMALQDVEEIDRTAFDAAIRRVIGAAATATEAADVAEIVTNATSVAVEKQRGSDTLATGFPKPDASPEPPVVSVPKEAVALFVGKIKDKDVSAAVAAAMAEPAASREELAARITTALDPIVQARADLTTNTAVAALQASGVIVTHYLLIPDMVDEIVTATQGTALSADQKAALTSSVGLSYPYRHLMDKALGADPIALPSAARPQFLAATWVPVAQVARETGPIATDCGCATKRADYSDVYGFFPFWASDLKNAKAEPNAQENESTAPPGAESRPQVGKIDFELFDRVAFEGLEVRRDGTVVNKDRWTEARGDFISSAHRHQVEADLAIRLRDWKDWQERDVHVVARAIYDLLGEADYPPKPVDDGFSLTYQLNRFLSRRPDGITLILGDYATEGETGPPLEKVVDLIWLLDAKIRADGSSKLKINLALHVDLQGASKGLSANPFADRDFKEIMPGNKIEQSPIYFLLFYLERPTKDAKKQLREIVENSFSGIRRIQVLRSIIPILPSEANFTTSRRVSEKPYGQFTDDILYFQDNFGGVGLWPATEVSRENGIGEILTVWLAPIRIAIEVEDDDEALAQVRPPPPLWQMNGAIRGVCQLTCPNRMAIYAVIVVTSAIGATLMVLSLYLGGAEGLIRKYRIVYGLFTIVMALLLLSETCDLPENNWALKSFTGLGLIMSGLAIYQWIYRKVDGPAP